MRATVYERVEHLPKNFSVEALEPMATTVGAVLCPPDHFDVLDVKNAFMAGNAGKVDRAEARREWESLRDAFSAAGARVELLKPLDSCEDMVFCANTALLGVDAQGRKTCLPGRMTFESRRPEVGSMTAWAQANGYRIVDDFADPGLHFEGSGDAVWHPGRRLLWGGYGWRTDPQVYHGISQALGVPVIALALTDSTFYHLDTCFVALDERTVLVHALAISVEGMEMVRRVFERVIEVDADEARRFACNATLLAPGVVALDRRASSTASRLRGLGFKVVELDTGEFLKSGGSAYCMKNAFF
jgi:N-dimethylarginine dimethylaminohydrolase